MGGTIRTMLARGLWLCIIIGASFAANANAACVGAASYDCVPCTQGETGSCRQPKDLSITKVQAAVDASLGSDGSVYGDGVYLKAGTQTWPTGLDISAKKGLVIRGAGSSNTNLNIADSAIEFSDADHARITGIHFNTPTGSHPIGGHGRQIRIDHNLFTGAASLLIWFYDSYHSNGVIDSNVFTVNVPATVIYVKGEDAFGRSTFEVPIDFGSADWVFVEGNTFNNTGDFVEMFENQNGGKIVVRWNTINEVSPSNMATLFEQHNTTAWGGDIPQGDGGTGGRAQEIYNNRVNYRSPVGDFIRMLLWRTGTGLVFNNVVDYSVRGGESLTYFELANYRADSGCTSGSTTNDRSPLLCSTCLARCCATSYVSDSLRGEGYPCVGGVGQGVYGGTPEPVYFWDNKKTGDGKTLVNLTAADVYVDPSAEWAIRLGRDYCVSTAGKPASCGGHPLVYTQYPCPHPLTGASESCDSSVAGADGYKVGRSAGDAPSRPTSLHVTR